MLRQERPKSDPNGVKATDTGLVEYNKDDDTGETLGNESDLHVLKGNGKGKCCEERYSHCGRYGHRVVECRKKDIKMIQWRRKKRVRQRKEPTAATDVVLKRRKWKLKLLDME